MKILSLFLMGIFFLSGCTSINSELGETICNSEGKEYLNHIVLVDGSQNIVFDCINHLDNNISRFLYNRTIGKVVEVVN